MMITVYKLNKLTNKQLSKIRETVKTTRGRRCKAEAFAQAVSALATKPVDDPKVGSSIARIYTYNLGNRKYQDQRTVFITCGDFVRWGHDRETVVTDYNYRGIYAGKIINLTDAAMNQLQNEFSALIF